MSTSIERAEYYVSQFAKVIQNHKTKKITGNIKVGVDLGTANIVLSIVTQDNKPLAGAIHPASAVRDGIVVDYLQAIDIVKKLKRKVEKMLGITLFNAATAVPPRSPKGSITVATNVLESAFLTVSEVFEETNVAAHVLGIRDGAVVDVGGGTTGISILKNGEIVYTADEPTGGKHMTLVLAGAKKIDLEQAEMLKLNKEKENEVYPIIEPVIEKMASIIQSHLRDFEDVKSIYVVGGASTISGFEEVFKKQIGIETFTMKYPLFITPLGIAMRGGIN